MRPAKRPKAPSREPFQDLVSINGRAASPRLASPRGLSKLLLATLPCARARLSFLIHAPPPGSSRLRLVAAGQAGHRDSQLPSAKSTLTMSGSRTPERAPTCGKPAHADNLAFIRGSLCAGRASPRWS